MLRVYVWGLWYTELVPCIFLSYWRSLSSAAGFLCCHLHGRNNSAHRTLCVDSPSLFLYLELS